MLHPKATSFLMVVGSFNDQEKKHTNKQINKQTNKQTKKQTNNQPNKQTNKQPNKPFIPHSTPTKKIFLNKSMGPKKRSIKEIWVKRTPTSGVGYPWPMMRFKGSKSHHGVLGMAISSSTFHWSAFLFGILSKRSGFDRGSAGATLKF